MRIDAYMQVSQIYQANKTKNAPKTGKAGSRDSLEISSFGIEDVADKMADALLS